MKILVLAGGLSPERDVSLASGCLIANALLAQGYRAALADVYIGVSGYVDTESFFDSAPTDGYHFKVPETAPDLEALRREHQGPGLIGPGITELCESAERLAQPHGRVPPVRHPPQRPAHDHAHPRFHKRARNQR